MTPSTWVRNLRDLQEGDHIKWKRPKGYDHHAIVEYVDYIHGRVHVIEYGTDDDRFELRNAEIHRSDHGVSGMYKYLYDWCYDAYTVLKRARSRIGETKYNLLSNNCEHFATWCKTGVKYCSQIRPFVARASIAGVEGVSGGCGTATGNLFSTCAAQAARNGTTMTGELQSLVCGGAKNAVKEVGKAVFNGGKEVGKLALRAGCKAACLGVSCVVTEACLFSYNCYKAVKNYKAAIRHADGNEMVQNCKWQRDKNIKEAACESIGALVGTAVGAALGSFIPVVGTAIGAFLGNCFGRLFGRKFGRGFFK